jgi:hypothetical protein
MNGGNARSTGTFRHDTLLFDQGTNSPFKFAFIDQ